MKNQLLILLAICFGAPLHAQIAIKNVNIVDVKSGKILPSSSVIIVGEQLTEVGPSSKIKIPANAQVIDGAGKFLMPGMVDAHIHFFQSGSLYTRPDVLDLRHKVPYEKERADGFKNTRDYLNRYLRLGITTVVDVGGPFTNFAIRDSIGKSGTLPNILVTGPLFSIVDSKEIELNDPPIVKVSSLADVDSLFQKMLRYKPDFIKIWYIAGPNNPAEKSFPLVKQVADLAHKNNLKLTVHATQLKTAQLAVEAGADILVHSVDDTIIPDDFIKILKDKKVSYTPTLIVMGNYYKTYSGKLDFHSQDLRWADAKAFGTLTDPNGFSEQELPAGLRFLRKNGIPKAAHRLDSIMGINVRKLVRAGVTVITGTDAGNIGTMHASSYLQELEAMLNAGLTPAEILKASTINPAIAFGEDKNVGSIEKGKLADLVLLDKNPLESIRNLNTINLVVKSGTVLDINTLVKESPEAIVQRQVNAYNARNIEAFLDTYSDDVELYNLNGPLMAKGKDQMRTIYAGLFERTPNLYCKIENRIVQGNKVIDQEYVRFGERYVSATALYEVENGKIKKVTFIQ